MVSSIIFTIITFLATFVLSASSQCLDSATRKACDFMFNISFYTSPCCDTSVNLINEVNDCQRIVGSTEFTCTLTDCVIKTKYGVTDANGDIDDAKVNDAADRLNKANPDETKSNDLLIASCTKEKYKMYTMAGPTCTTLMFETCGTMSYIRACSPFYNTPPCQQMQESVNTCAPVFDKYIQERFDKTCD